MVVAEQPRQPLSPIIFKWNGNVHVKTLYHKMKSILHTQAPIFPQRLVIDVVSVTNHFDQSINYVLLNNLALAFGE
jgi:hypothetical protein